MLLHTIANGQTEHWDTYMAKFGDKPGSVLVDMGYKDIAPDEKYPYLLVTGPQAMNCDKQGLPDKEEIDRLEEILDATSNFITGVTAKTLVGTLTYNCERLNYYYVKDTMGIRYALMRMYNRNYSNYKYAINIKPDRGWSTYKTFLYPNEETMDWMVNDKIIAKMIQEGDSLIRGRDINFDLYFKTDTGRRSFVQVAHSRGYKTDTTGGNKNNGMYELVASKYGMIRTNVLDSMTHELKGEMKKYNAIYNGWEAPLPAAHSSK